MVVNGDTSGLGSLIGEAWNAKRGISASVSGHDLDAMHERIMAAGASGAKLLGAGGGGFLVHFTQETGIREILASLRQMDSS